MKPRETDLPFDFHPAVYEFAHQLQYTIRELKSYLKPQPALQKNIQALYIPETILLVS